MGDKEPVEEDDEVISYAEPSRGIYKKLVVRNNRLAGAIIVGDGPVVPALLRVYSESSAIPANRAELMFQGAPAVRRGVAASGPGHGADLQLQRRHEGADHRRACSEGRAAFEPCPTRRGREPAADRASPKCS